jgi:hypothetical protein
LNNPLLLDDTALAAHMRDLNDEQLVDLLARMDTAEIVEKSKPRNLTASALFYAQRLNWPVFPIIARGKRPLTTRGFKDASRDPQQIRSWWQQWPDANIGTPTGAEGCGYDVIDVDGRTGLTSLLNLKHSQCPPDCSAETFCNATGDLPPVLARAFTPGSTDGPGWHYYIRATGDGNSSGYLPGMDYRGAGGYVVIPPSVGMNGKHYTWLTKPPIPT